MTFRSLRAIHPAYRDDIGDLVTRRPVPGPGLDQIDPFLFLNHHGPQIYAPGNRGLPFGPHPHRGFETVTFILEGELSHLDTGGHESIIAAGGVQWMTAGRGLVHAELSPASFKQRGGPLEILQLWVNLPSRLKMTEPRYTGLQRAQIPMLPLDSGRATAHLVAGELEGQVGPVDSLTGVFMSLVELGAQARVALPAPRERNVFLYVVRGDVVLGGRQVEAYNLVEVEADADAVELSTQAGAVVLFGHADPIGEPVAAHGPFVMTTRDEIVQAVRDYQAGMFGTLAV